LTVTEVQRSPNPPMNPTGFAGGLSALR